MKRFGGTQILTRRSHVRYINADSKRSTNKYIKSNSSSNSTSSDSDPARTKSTKGDFSKFDAMELVLCLNSKERQYLYNALQKYEFYQIKKEYEGRIACHRWRTRIGWRRRNRFFKPEDIESDMFAMPDSWIEKMQDARSRVEAPTFQELCHLSFANALPFVAFGFLDNSIMILTGESIEINIKAYLVISTMAAAALGNTFSDIVGLWSTHYVERAIEFLGFRAPELSPYQLKMPISRRFINGGRLIGITVGCLLGMLPLLFFEAN